MRGKVVLLYETEAGKLLCDMASRVLTEIAVAFRHTLTLPVKRCPVAADVTDEALDLCADALGVLAGESGMRSLPALASELFCTCRIRELRYTHLIENHGLMGPDKPLKTVIVQALEGDEKALRQAAEQAFLLSGRESLPVIQVPPNGRLAPDWQTAVARADKQSTLFHAREYALQDIIPAMVHEPARFGVVLCPPYGGAILSDAAAALTGAEGMCYDVYIGGESPLCAPLSQIGEQMNPIGMLRAVEELLLRLQLDREAACVEAAIRNVLQAGWRVGDVAASGMPHLEADGITELICQQIEVAGEWITNV